jgi:hypothetical protein
LGKSRRFGIQEAIFVFDSALSGTLNLEDIFPVNPQSLARYRQAFYPSRAKDDPVDSQLLEELIRLHPDRLRIYRPGPGMMVNGQESSQRNVSRIGWIASLIIKEPSQRKTYYKPLKPTSCPCFLPSECVTV